MNNFPTLCLFYFIFVAFTFFGHSPACTIKSDIETQMYENRIDKRCYNPQYTWKWAVSTDASKFSFHFLCSHVEMEMSFLDVPCICAFASFTKQKKRKWQRSIGDSFAVVFVHWYKIHFQRNFLIIKWHTCLLCQSTFNAKLYLNFSSIVFERVKDGCAAAHVDSFLLFVWWIREIHITYMIFLFCIPTKHVWNFTFELKIVICFVLFWSLRCILDVCRSVHKQCALFNIFHWVRRLRG